MFESLKQWCRFPFLLYHHDGSDKAGDAKWKVEEAKGYRVDDVVQLVDENNNSFMSQSRVYVDADLNITATTDDMLAFPEEPTKRYKIRKVGAFFDGNTGEKSVSIFYL